MPARAVMIGDTEYDIAMGRAAGMRDHRRRLGLSRRRPADRRRRRRIWPPTSPALEALVAELAA